MDSTFIIWSRKNIFFKDRSTGVGSQILPAYRISILEIINSVFISEMFEFHIRVLSLTVCYGFQLPGIEGMASSLN